MTRMMAQTKRVLCGGLEDAGAVWNCYDFQDAASLFCENHES